MSNYFIPDSAMDTAYNPSRGLGGVYNNKSFSDIFPTAEEFAQAYENSGLAIPMNRISAEVVPTVFYLLMSRYRNNHPMSYDENRFKADLFSIIFAYGPSWEANLKIQKEFRDLIGTDELTDGSTTIANHANNPSTIPAPQFGLIGTIDDQNATKRKKPKIEAYAGLAGVLKTDITNQFLEKFRRLFRVIVEPDGNLVYTTTPEEQEILR